MKKDIDTRISEFAVADGISDAILEYEDFEGMIQSFAQANVETREEGFVLTDTDGNRFQVTVTALQGA